MKLVSFLIVLHSLFYFAGTEGMISHQAGATNEHKQFVERFDSNSTDTVDVADQDASIFDQIRITAQAIPFLGFIVEVFSAPYVFIENTSVPDLYVMLFQSLLGFFETASIVSFIRGFDF